MKKGKSVELKELVKLSLDRARVELAYSNYQTEAMKQILRETIREELDERLKLVDRLCELLQLQNKSERIKGKR
jgi:hypothetical protein